MKCPSGHGNHDGAYSQEYFLQPVGGRVVQSKSLANVDSADHGRTCLE